MYSSLDDSTVCNKISRDGIDCTNEEADTRLFVHLNHAIENDTKATIMSNDTDIIIIAMSLYS